MILQSKTLILPRGELVSYSSLPWVKLIRIDGRTFRLDIVDTAGQEEYRDMLGSLFSGDAVIDGYLLVYDITSPTSLEHLEYFDELIEKNSEAGLRPDGYPAPVKIVAGNKCDLGNKLRIVSSAEGQAWAKAHGCGFMETSAKVMVNIEETFLLMIRNVATARGLQPLAERPKSSVKETSTSQNQKTDFTQKESDNRTSAELKRGGCCVLS